MSRSTLAWVALALAGLIAAVSVSYAASQLSRPKVGLTSEPVSGVAELAPKQPGGRRPATTVPAPAPTTTVPMPTTAPVPDEDGEEEEDD
jgi:hypothetical protein